MRTLSRLLFFSMLITVSCNKSNEPPLSTDQDVYGILKSTSVDLPEFCAEDESYGLVALGDLQLAEGTAFDGMTVQEVLDEANVVLGGGASPYSFQSLHNAISMVNEYYVDGQWTGNGELLKDCRYAME